jgi:hypothetical protein
MIAPLPDTPLTLAAGAEQFSTFLSANAYPENIRWVTRHQITLGNDNMYYVSFDGAEEGQIEAERRYEEGLTRGLGILLQAICCTTDATIASVYFPSDTEDAQQRRMLPGLKLSCPTSRVLASFVTDNEHWARLNEEMEQRSRLINETYDL